ncbi:MAG: IS21 family transposase [Acidobacteria bacterium]|nr:IS21 family transposase [Acidobacteriota bacterium]
MERRQKVELFEQLRREYEFGCATIVGTAQKFGVHRRMVRQAIESATPPERKRPVRQRPKLEQVRAFIDRIITEDRRAPRKQRHTAHRIYERVRAELPEVAIAERTMRRYVAERKEQLGAVAREVFVPQQYAPGGEAQVDWYEAVVELAGVPQTVQFFSMRAMWSGAAFHRAYLRATQQAFLEAHELAFAYFGGVFRRLRYDNLKSAVKKILRGARREQTVRFIAFRSHYQYEASFCTPAQGHEKGGVEGEVGRFRRNHLVPIPACRDVCELNAYLEGECQRDEARRIGGRELAVGEALQLERSHLARLPQEGFELAEESFSVVDQKGCIRARTNWYSTPLRPGRRCRVRVLATHLEVLTEGQLVARHERCYGRQQQVLNLEHYLDVLERKPGALSGSKPLAQWRAEGRWTSAYDELWQHLQQRHGVQAGTRQMIAVLQLGREAGYAQLSAAITRALALGARDAAAVRYLLQAEQLEGASAPPLCLPVLEMRAPVATHYERPLPSVVEYDTLLKLTSAPAVEVRQ